MSRQMVFEGETGHRRLSGRLGMWAVVFMSVAAAAPLTVIGGVLPVGASLGNGIGAASMFTLGGVILLFFSVSLATMGRVVPRPGAFFTYVGYGLGRSMGLAAAWLAILTYTAIQAASYAFLGQELSLAVVSLNGPDIPWWAYAIVILVVVSVLGYRHIELSGKVLGVLLILEIAVVLVLSFAIVFTNANGQGLSAAPFAPSNAFSGAWPIGLMFGMAGFVGFESVAVFRDEAKNPAKTIPRATYAAVIVITVFYTFTAWALTMGWGQGFVSEVTQHADSFIIDTAFNYLGVAGQGIVTVLLLTSIFAAVLSFHNVVTRYQHAMSNAGVLPRAVGRVHPKYRSPYLSSTIQSVTALVFIIVFAAIGLDPVAQIFGWFTGVATFAITILMGLTCLASIVYFVRNRLEVGVWRKWIAPIIGLLGLVGAVTVGAINFPVLVGDIDAAGNPFFGPLSIVLLIVIVAFPVFGIAQGFVMRARNPEAFRRVTETIAEDVEEQQLS